MSSDPIRRDIEQRARRALISYAIFRWESAVIIGLTILLAIFYPQPFPWWRWWAWLVIGAVAEIAIIVTSLTDERTGQQVVEDLFEEEHSPRAIRSAEYRQQYEKARDYRRQIKQTVQSMPAGPLRERLERAGQGVADWVAHIYELACRLDRYAGNAVIARDMRAVPDELKQLEGRYRLEDDAGVRAELSRAIEQKRAQIDNLRQLQNTMETAQLRLEATLTALGTVYSQVLLAAAKGGEGAGAEQLAADIKEQTAALQDLIKAMDEVLK
jgi:hypothetical protein